MQNPVQININLLEKEPINRGRWYYWSLSFALMAILGGLTAYYDVSRDRELSHLQDVNTDLKAQIIKYDQKIAQTIPLEEMKELINDKAKKMDLINKSQRSYVEAWGSIDRAVPAQVFVVGVEIISNKVHITGFSPDYEQLAVFSQNLEHSPNFKNVAALSSKMDEKSSEISFSMEMNWGAGGN